MVQQLSGSRGKGLGSLCPTLQDHKKSTADNDFSTEDLKSFMHPPKYWTQHWESPSSTERLKRRISDLNDSAGTVLIPTNIYVATFGDVSLPPYTLVLGKHIYT